jgi:hypothetical protein
MLTVALLDYSRVQTVLGQVLARLERDVSCANRAPPRPARDVLLDWYTADSILSRFARTSPWLPRAVTSSTSSINININSGASRVRAELLLLSHLYARDRDRDAPLPSHTSSMSCLLPQVLRLQCPWDGSDLTACVHIVPQAGMYVRGSGHGILSFVLEFESESEYECEYESDETTVTTMLSAVRVRALAPNLYHPFLDAAQGTLHLPSSANPLLRVADILATLVDLFENAQYLTQNCTL